MTEVEVGLSTLGLRKTLDGCPEKNDPQSTRET